MERWNGVLKVPLFPNTSACYRVAASLCLSPTSHTFAVPSANAIFFNGDRVEGTGNPVIERLSDLQRIAHILVSKFGTCINAWVVEASVFNGPFAVYQDFIPSVNQFGEPKSYTPVGFPASTSIISLLSNCLEEAKNVISRRQIFAACYDQPKTFILGFSKGGTVLNQLVTELAFSDIRSTRIPPHTEQVPMGGGEVTILPATKECLLNSITGIHYLDVGLNSPGAYLTDCNVIERIARRSIQGATGIRFVLHGTPRQWSDRRRVLIRDEKDKMLHMLQYEAQRSQGKLQVLERFYFADKPPNMQMHFEIIETFEIRPVKIPKLLLGPVQEASPSG